MRYQKPALSMHDQLTQLQDRGLDTGEATRTMRYLTQIGYYRLSPYMIPFQIPDGSHQFRPRFSFDDVLNHYVFDRRLRLLIMDALERFEVALRAALSNHMSVTRGTPFWYLEQSNFAARYDHARLLRTLTEAMDQERDRLDGDLQRLQDRPPRNLRSAEEAARKQTFLRHYISTYSEPALPPSWMMIEMMTFGDLMHLYRGLADRSDQKAIAQELGITDELLSSWLGTFQFTRNLCAHHSRLWNRQFGVSPRIPRSTAVHWLQDPEVFRGRGSYRRYRVFPVVVALQTILKSISPGSTWARKVQTLLTEFPTVPLHPMGFPDDWHTDPFWSPHLP